MRQLDQAFHRSLRRDDMTRSTLTSNSATAKQSQKTTLEKDGEGREITNSKLFKERPRYCKLRTSCTRRGEYEHWTVGPAGNGTIHDGLPSNDPSPLNCGQRCNHSECKQPDNRTGPHLGDAAMQLSNVKPMVSADAREINLYGGQSSGPYNGRARESIVDSGALICHRCFELSLIC